MFSRLLIFTLIIGFTVGVVVKTPITRKESLDAKLVREKRYHELRVLNRVRLAKSINPFVSRFDVARQPLYDYADQEFNVRVNIGTPGQEIEVIPDMGSANTWVIDKTCNGSASYQDCPNYCYTNKQWCALFCEDYCCGTNSTLRTHPIASGGDPCAGRTLFDSSASSTYQSTGKDFQIAGGVGNVSGIVGQDTFVVGDLKSGSTISIFETTFGQADRLGVSYSAFKFNGVLGLGFLAASSDDTVPVFQHAIDQGVLDKPVFSIWLQKGGVQAQDTVAGALTFGAQDTDYCSSDVTFIPLISKTIWWINIAAIATNDKKTEGQYVRLDWRLVPDAVSFEQLAFVSYLCVVPRSIVRESMPKKQSKVYVVKNILDKRFVNGEVEYLVQWKGYNNPKYNSWEPMESFISCDESIAAFEEKLKAAETNAIGIESEGADQKSQKRSHIQDNDNEFAGAQPTKKNKESNFDSFNELSYLGDVSTWKKDRYRVEFDQSPRIFGVRRVNNELYVLCAFRNEMNVEVVEATPYDVIRLDCNVKFNWTVFVDSQTKLELKASDLLFQYPNGNCYLSFTSYDGAVMGIDIVLGIPVLQAYCQTYDYENGKIGFSKPL
ncbi:Aspartic protease [Aphelenchoides besseyi]|nr:Aspartic protease [Aphelenchoides besseyi]